VEGSHGEGVCVKLLVCDFQSLLPVDLFMGCLASNRSMYGLFAVLHQLFRFILKCEGAVGLCYDVGFMAVEQCRLKMLYGCRTLYFSS